MAIDFEAEGLLKGTRGKARQARRELLEELAADAVPLEELRYAVEEDRLALLPVERLLEGGGPRYTGAEVAERVGIDLAQLRFLRQAIGLPMPPEDEPGFTEADLAAARRVRSMLDAGLPVDEMLEVTRAIGVAMSQVTAASRGLVRRAMLHPGDTELDVARRYLGAAQGLRPLMGPTLEYFFDLHLREQLRSDALDRAQLAAGRVAGSEEIAACFADLVGFTGVGERLDPEDLGAMVGRLGELAGDVAAAPVRLVKMIGDAAMLVSADTDAVLDAALTLVAAADDEEGLPQLRAGLARGSAVRRAGDWYGRPVNLASRITAIAYPGSVLASEEVRDAVRGEYRWSFAGRRRLKGFEDQVKLYRARREEDRANAPGRRD